MQLDEVNYEWANRPAHAAFEHARVASLQFGQPSARFSSALASCCLILQFSLLLRSRPKYPMTESEHPSSPNTTGTSNSAALSGEDPPASKALREIIRQEIATALRHCSTAPPSGKCMHNTVGPRTSLSVARQAQLRPGMRVH